MDKDNNISYGYNNNTNEKLYYKETPSRRHNEMVIGSTGCGKTTFCQNKVKELYNNTDDYIIVVKTDTILTNDYSQVLNDFNGEHINIKDFKFNPFKIYNKDFIVNEDDYRDIIRDKCMSICSLLEIINRTELSCLHKSIICDVSNSLYNNVKEPTLTNLFTDLKEFNRYDMLKMPDEYSTKTVSDILKGGRKSVTDLYNYVDNVLAYNLSGIIKNYDYKFAQLKNLDNNNEFKLCNRLTVFDFSELPNTVYNEYAFSLLTILYDIIKSNKYNKPSFSIIIDDAHNFLKNKCISNFIISFLIRLRLFGAKIDIVLPDYYFTPDTSETFHEVIRNISYFTILNINNVKDTMNSIGKIAYSLYDDNIDYIYKANIGQGLMINESNEITKFKFKYF